MSKVKKKRRPPAPAKFSVRDIRRQETSRPVGSSTLPTSNPAGEYYRQPPGFTGEQGCRHANADTASDTEIKKE